MTCNEDLEEKKKKFAMRFRLEMRLHLRRPKPGRSGTSNDGNTARRCNNDAALPAAVMGIGEDLVLGFLMTLRAVTRGYRTDKYVPNT